MVFIATIAGSIGAASAQDYPTRPIRLLHGFAAGGAADTLSRILANGLSKRLGQPIVIEAKPGSGGNLAAAAIAKAEPDGYTIGLVTGAHAISGALYKSLPYDSVDSFEMISTVVYYALVIAVRSDYEAKSLGGIDRARQGKAGRSQFCFGWIWQHPPSGRRAPGNHGRHQDGARSLSRRFADRHRASRRRDSGGRGNAGAAGAANRERRDSRPCRDVADPHAAASKRSLRPTKPALRGSTCGPGPGCWRRRARRRRSSSGSTPRFAKPSRIAETKKALETAIGGEVQASTPEEMRALIQSQIVKWADVIKTSDIPRL